MIPTTVIGLVVLTCAVLPGAVLIWGYERQAGSFGVSAGDRVLRFIGASAVVHAIAAPAEYWVYGRLDPWRGWPSFWWVWVTAVAMLAVCSWVGGSIGRLHRTRLDRDAHWSRIRRGWLTRRREETLLRHTFGPDPAPRAWDALFSERPNVYLRVRLTDESWVAGLFAEESYAGGHPHPTDLYLEQGWKVHPDTGELVEGGLAYGIYIPADRIQWFEVIPHRATGVDAA